MSNSEVNPADRLWLLIRGMEHGNVECFMGETSLIRYLIEVAEDIPQPLDDQRRRIAEKIVRLEKLNPGGHAAVMSMMEGMLSEEETLRGGAS